MTQGGLASTQRRDGEVVAKKGQLIEMSKWDMRVRFRDL